MNRRVAFTLALALAFTRVVGAHAEAAIRLPDLIVSAVSAPSTAQPGMSITLSASIKNQGKASASTVQAAFYLTKSASSTTGATLLGTQNVGSLSAGATLALTTTLSIPSSTSPGTFYVVAVADPSNAIKESNETNNTRASGAIAVKDLTPPTISAVNATQITASNATITWTTDKTSTSQADYGTTAAYGSSTSPDSSLVTSHAVTLSGLTAGMVHHFRVQSKDAAGNAALSTDYTFTTAASTAGNTYYVATTGSDANPGTDALPFHTISYGVSVLTPGDTLYVKSGTYAEALIDNIPGGTSWGASVTVAAYPGQTVTIRPASGSDYVLHFQGTTQAYIIIDGLIIDGVNLNSGLESISITSGPGTVETAAHHIRIQNCEIKNSPGNGIFVKYAYANEFINLDVHHNGATNLDHGLYIKSSGNLIQGSRVYSNAGYGIQLYNDLGGVDNNIVRGNQVYENGSRGMILSSGDGNSAYNNIIWGNFRGGITINYGTAPTNTKVYNNTVYANGANDPLGIYVGAASVGAVIRNNIVYQNGSGIIDAGANTVSDHNLVDIDPRFVNVAALDFHLQFVSPAVDTGITASAVTTDFDGIQRPQGSAYDIGAFE